MAHRDVWIVCSEHGRAYQKLGRQAASYDGMMTCSTIPGRAIRKVVWDMGRADNHACLRSALSGIAPDFCGRLLGSARRHGWRAYMPR